MAKPRLNKKQRRWVKSFLEKYPYLQVEDIIDTYADMDRLIYFGGLERLPSPNIPNFQGKYPAYIRHLLKVVLRKYGDLRKTAIHETEIIYLDAQCEYVVGQISLNINEALAPPKIINPAVASWKPKQKLKPKQGIQLSLPVTGLEAKVFELRQQKRSHLPPVSSEELLQEKVSTWSQRDQTEVELPQVLVDVLIQEYANDEEWQSAIDLYQVVGLPGAMHYATGLAVLRRLSGKPEVPIVAASISVKAASGVKPTVEVRLPDLRS